MPRWGSRCSQLWEADAELALLPLGSLAPPPELEPDDGADEPEEPDGTPDVPLAVPDDPPATPEDDPDELDEPPPLAREDAAGYLTGVARAPEPA